MASMSLVRVPVAVVQTSSLNEGLHIRPGCCLNGGKGVAMKGGRKSCLSLKQVVRESVGTGKAGVVCAVGDVSADSTNYLIAGAVAVALVGTAFPLLFSRKDVCPECGGAGFVRGQASGGALRANAARKDQKQIVCKTCNGLGKLGQTDKRA